MASENQHPSLGKRIARGTLWVMAARMIVRAMGLISTLVLARLLVPEDFGLVAIGIAMMQLLTNIADIGVSQTVVKFRKTGPDFLDTLFTLGLLRGLITGLILLAIAFFADNFYQEPRAFWVFLGVALVPVLQGLVNPKFHEFERDLDFSKTFRLQAAAKLASVIVAVTIALTFRSFWAIIASLWAGVFVEAVLSYILQPYRPRLKLAVNREMLSFMGWLTGVSFITALNNKLDAILMPRLTNTSIAGAYYIGYQLVDLATVEITTPVVKAIYPGLAEQQDEVLKMRQTFLQGVEVLGAVCLPIAFGMAFVSADLVRVLLGDGWDGAAMILLICAPFEGLMTLMLPLYAFAIARGQAKYILIRELIFFLIRIPLFIWAALTFGLVGAAVASAAGSFLKWIVSLAVYAKISSGTFWEPVWQVRRSIFACIAMSLYFLVLRPFLPFIEELPVFVRLLADVTIGAVTYLGAHYAGWRISGSPAGIEQNIMVLLAGIRTRAN